MAQVNRVTAGRLHMAERREHKSLPRRVVVLWPYAVSVGLLAVGIGAFVYMAKAGRSAGEASLPDPGRLVSAFRAERVEHQTAVTAYGTTQAGTIWTAIAEVAGRAVEVSDRFEPGAFLPAGTVLIRIDRTDYQLAKDRYEAEVQTKEQMLAELGQQEKNLKTVLALRERRLKLANTELERVRDLFEKKVETPRALDQAEAEYVAQLTAIQETRNALGLVPAQRAQLAASLKLAKVQVAQAEVNLGKTKIKLPFAARCSEKQVEPDQYVAPGTRLGVFFSLDKAEVVVMAEGRQLLAILPREPDPALPEDLSDSEELSGLTKMPFEIPAEVRWAAGDMPATWKGKVVRIEAAIDPQSQSLRIVVEVPGPYKGLKPGVRPPLIPEAFAKVTLYGRSLKDVFVVPRECVRDGRVYVIRESKLHISPVEVELLEADLAVVRSGIEPGDYVVLADVFPAVEGMPLRAKEVGNPVVARTTSRPSPDDGPRAGRPNTREATQ